MLNSCLSQLYPWDVLIYIASSAPSETSAIKSDATTNRNLLIGEIQAANARLRTQVIDPIDLLDNTLSDETIHVVLPQIRHLIDLYDQLRRTDPQMESFAETESIILWIVLAARGDGDAYSTMETITRYPNKSSSIAARMGCLCVHWLKSCNAEPEQVKILRDIQELINDHPTENSIVPILGMIQKYGAASPELRRQLTTTIIDVLKAPNGQAFVAQLRYVTEMLKWEGEPLDLAGKTVGGTFFSADIWRGRVIMIDFWATWCGPCRAELPKLEELYEKYHSRGLEIIGISCDDDPNAVGSFMAQRPRMSWPQLTDKNMTNNNSLCEKYGVRGLPTLFFGR